MNTLSDERNLLTQVGQVVNNYEKSLRVTGNGFSFIQALRLESDEVRFHTRLIGYLLDPNEEHFQGDKFMKLFFEAVGIEEDPKGFTVKIEKHVGKKDWENVEGGRIDLLISNSSKKIAFVVEVKIYAAEQEMQLQRYYNYLNRFYGNISSKVYYLTLQGDQSFNDKKFNKYQPISFKDHMLKWIESCRLASIDQPVIRESLTQYIANIKRLTNQNPDKIMDNELISLVTDNESNLKAYFSLLGTQFNIRRMMVNTLASKIQKDIESTGNRFKVNFSDNLGAKDSSIEFIFYTNPSVKISLYWLSQWDVIGIGILTDKKESDVLRNAIHKKLDNLRLGKYHGNNKIWVWLMNIDSLARKPKLNYSDWEYFTSDSIVHEIRDWVDQIADAYEAVLNEMG
jgi:hypothetical protein